MSVGPGQLPVKRAGFDPGAAWRWYARKGLGRLKALIGGGSFVWPVTGRVRFVYLSNDGFSQLLYHHGGHELLELRWWEAWLRDHGRRVVDCGANIGWFSAFLSQQLPQIRCLAIEGNPTVAARGASVVARLGLQDRIEFRTLVLGEGGGRSYVVPDLPGREAWQRARPVAAAAADAGNATLDELVAAGDRVPDLVKIDCEGFETRILQGAPALLARRSLAWMVECNRQALQSAGSSPAELIGRFRAQGYVCRHLASFDRQMPFGIEVDGGFASASFNFAAIPEDPAFAGRWEAVGRRLGAAPAPGRPPG